MLNELTKKIPGSKFFFSKWNSVRKSKDGHDNENEEQMFQELASEMVGKLRSLAGHEDESLEEHD